MSMTMEDVKYEQYLEDLHDSYIESLEKLANSKNISELKKNLEELKETKTDVEELIDTNVNKENLGSLSKILQEIHTIEEIYKNQISDSERNRKFFLINIFLAIANIVLAIFAVLLIFR